MHRLDRATSGVMIAAKTEEAQTFLQKQFAARTVQKTYVALVKGTPKEPKAHIIAPLMRHPNTPKLFMVHENGKPAETKYTVVKTINGISMLELYPLTGRTHQLRLHLDYIGHAIIGDELYASNSENESRMYLHAQSLRIQLPSGKETTFEAPLPPEFNERMEQ